MENTREDICIWLFSAKPGSISPPIEEIQLLERRMPPRQLKD